MSQIIQKLDLNEHITTLQLFFAREKEIILQGDTNLHYKFIDSLKNSIFTPPKKIKDLNRSIMILAKQGVLKLDDIYEFVKIINYFNYLKTKDLPQIVVDWLFNITFPNEIIEITQMFDENGKLKPSIDENLEKYNNLLEKEKKSIRDRLFQFTNDTKLSTFLVDRQVHYIHNEDALLLRGGFSSVLSGKIVARSSAGFFYVVPNSIETAKNSINQLENKIADIILEYEKKISSIFYKLIKFVKYIDREFDRFDHYQGRVHFARAKDLHIILPTNNDEIYLKNFAHPAIKDPKPSTVDFSKKVLMITGVNAGGKTMLLKSILSAVYMAKYLIPFKCNPKDTKIGKFKFIEAIVEDPQNSKNDISTFAGRMDEFSRIFNKKELIVGVDEIELGTDSDEAASLFKVIIEELVSNGSKIVITTHHKRLAALMASNENVELIAAVYDEKKQQPTFDFIQGSIGNSYAFETALRYKIPHRVIAKAKECYGEDKEKLNDLIQRSSQLELNLKQKITLVEKKQKDLDDEILKTKVLKENLIQSYKDKEQTLDNEYKLAINEAKKAAKSQDPKEIHKLLNKAHQKKQESKQEVEIIIEKIEIGDSVKYAGINSIVLDLKKDNVLLDCDGKRVYAHISKLKKAPRIPKIKTKTDIKVQKPTSAHVKLDLHGLRAHEAIDELDSFLSNALIAGYDEVLIFHGIGSGKLSRAVKEFLKEHPRVVEFCDAPVSMGGYGATIAKL